MPARISGLTFFFFFCVDIPGKMQLWELNSQHFTNEEPAKREQLVSVKKCLILLLPTIFIKKKPFTTHYTC